MACLSLRKGKKKETASRAGAGVQEGRGPIFCRSRTGRGIVYPARSSSARDLPMRVFSRDGGWYFGILDVLRTWTSNCIYTVQCQWHWCPGEKCLRTNERGWGIETSLLWSLRGFLKKKTRKSRYLVDVSLGIERVPRIMYGCICIN